MGVDVSLVRVNQRGTSPKRRQVTKVGTFRDVGDRFAGLCSASGLPMLTRIDPYKTVVLTAAEMEQLVAELDALRERDRVPAEVVALVEVRRLALICARDPAMELHFDGD